MITIPSGSLQGDIMVMDWDSDRLDIIAVDDTTGYPIDSSTNSSNLGTAVPKITTFATFPSNASPWGMIFDPMTNDILVSSWSSSSAQTHQVLM